MDDEILVFEEEVDMVREEEDIPPSLSLGDNDPSEDNDNSKVNSTVGMGLICVWSQKVGTGPLVM